MPYAFAYAEGTLYTGLINGRVFATNDSGDDWQELQVSGETVERISAMAAG
jgi:hypothetical protein